ncbi:uncharacterized protein BYT42DRAFT_316887 [Radiomyces spectabilis]|uniref:uncharacterized protein n=1 Tax=Radiomyces spectabilis TaxID=64574 RepID=UPI002220EB8F|nr:uncharacterized protein BYT42DRAFT_316887 [Radiomyces spectabilis]KAI8379185.1 hypothetical protein BYT42DRAFT_316887 [Radiomyces spectabilis]
MNRSSRSWIMPPFTSDISRSLFFLYFELSKRILSRFLIASCHSVEHCSLSLFFCLLCIAAGVLRASLFRCKRPQKLLVVPSLGLRSFHIWFVRHEKFLFATSSSALLPPPLKKKTKDSRCFLYYCPLVFLYIAAV